MQVVQSGPSSRQTQSVMTRERLLEAATRLFAERGYGKSSVKNIAEAAGISQGSVFWHFESKQRLLFEVVDRAFARWEQEVLEPLLRKDAEPDGLRAVVDAHLGFARRNPEIGGRLFFMLASEALGGRAELRAAYARIYDRFRNHGREWIEQAVKVGACRDDIDPAATATVIVGALAGIFLQWLVGGAAVDLVRSHDDLARILARGIAA